jgi:hypothetical protein
MPFSPWFTPQTPELIMTVLPDVSQPDGRASAQAMTSFYALVDDKAGSTSGSPVDEFRRLWRAGAYKHDVRPQARALDRLMRTGEW